MIRPTTRAARAAARGPRPRATLMTGNPTRLEPETELRLYRARLLHDRALLIRAAELLVRAARDLKRRVVVREVEHGHRHLQGPRADLEGARYLNVDA